MLLWRRNFLHTAIMRLMVPNTPHRDSHPASPASWAVWFFFWFIFAYHPQVWVGVGVDLLICVCTSESQLTCCPPRSLPQPKSNQDESTSSRLSFSKDQLKWVNRFKWGEKANGFTQKPAQVSERRWKNLPDWIHILSHFSGNTLHG